MNQSTSRFIHILLSGIITWLVPFLLAFILLRSGSASPLDAYLVENLIVVISAAVIAGLFILYFKTVYNEFFRQSIIVGVSWLVINWVLDLVIYLPLSRMDIPMYLAQGGIRYLTILIMTATVGYLVELKVKHIMDVVNKKRDI